MEPTWEEAAPVRTTLGSMAGKARGKKDLMLAKEIGARLRKLREDRLVSQRELARGIRIEIAQISRYERGLSLPSLETLIDLCRFLRIGLETFVFGKEQQATTEPPIEDITLLERFRDVEKLSRKDRETVITLVDAMIARRQLEEIGSRRIRRSA